MFDNENAKVFAKIVETDIFLEIKKYPHSRVFKKNRNMTFNEVWAVADDNRVLFYPSPVFVVLSNLLSAVL